MLDSLLLIIIDKGIKGVSSIFLAHHIRNFFKDQLATPLRGNNEYFASSGCVHHLYKDI